jgi:hypothetical protein
MDTIESLQQRVTLLVRELEAKTKHIAELTEKLETSEAISNRRANGLGRIERQCDRLRGMLKAYTASAKAQMASITEFVEEEFL